MKNAACNIVNGVRNFFVSIGQSSTKMGKQIGNYVDEQIDERYENMKTGKPREDRKAREKLKFKAGIVFILCLLIIVAIPVTFIFSSVKGKLIEFSIKSPNEIMMNLDDKAEIYPEVEVLSGVYIPDATAQTVGTFWQDGGNGRNTVVLHDGEYVLSGAIDERVSPANFLQLQYDSSVRDVIKVYTEDMNLFCMMEDPVLYQESSYIAANPYIILHAKDGFSQWEIFSFYECRMDEMDMISQQSGQAELYNYLTAKSSYQQQPATENEVTEEQTPVVFEGNILVIMATDESNSTSYILGAKMVV